jgi:hypothetical protein
MKIKKLPHPMCGQDYPAMPILDLSGLQAGKNYLLTGLDSANCFEYMETDENESVMFLASDNGKICTCIKFRRFSEHWLPIYHDIYNNPGPPLKKSEYSVAFVKNWPWYSQTRTEWKSHPKYGHVPFKMFLRRRNMPGELDEVELQFAEWKFGKDVDLSPLAKEAFTTEKIIEYADFEGWKSLFDQ